MKRLVVFLMMCMTSSSYAQESYIDKIKKELKEEESSEGYSEKFKKEIEDQTSSENYTEALKQKIIEDENSKDSTSEGYADQIRTSLPEEAPGSTIADVKSGKLELDPIEFGKPSSSFGFKMGATVSSNIQAQGSGSSGNSLTDVYGDGWFPDISIFYEWFPFHSRFLGNMGIRAGVGLVILRGTGQFNPAPRNDIVGTISSSSQTEFRFAYVPIQLSANYRFNLLKYVKPTVQVGALVVPYEESRNDGNDSKRGFSTSLIFGGGVSILLDWIAPKNRFSLHRTHGVKSYHLNIEYKVITALTGTLRYASSGLYAGFSFDI